MTSNFALIVSVCIVTWCYGQVPSFGDDPTGDDSPNRGIFSNPTERPTTSMRKILDDWPGNATSVNEVLLSLSCELDLANEQKTALEKLTARWRSVSNSIGAERNKLLEEYSRRRKLIGFAPTANQEAIRELDDWLETSQVNLGKKSNFSVIAELRSILKRDQCERLYGSYLTNYEIPYRQGSGLIGTRVSGAQRTILQILCPELAKQIPTIDQGTADTIRIKHEETSLAKLKQTFAKLCNSCISNEVPQLSNSLAVKKLIDSSNTVMRLELHYTQPVKPLGEYRGNSAVRWPVSTFPSFTATGSDRKVLIDWIATEVKKRGNPNEDISATDAAEIQFQFMKKTLDEVDFEIVERHVLCRLISTHGVNFTLQHPLVQKLLAIDESESTAISNALVKWSDIWEKEQNELFKELLSSMEREANKNGTLLSEKFELTNGTSFANWFSN